MPIGIDKAPKTLPKAAKTLWVDTFNGVFENCDGSEKECDARAAKVAWSQIKGKYRKVKDEWILRKSEAYQDVLLTITKASLQPDGSVRWQAVASDTGKDRSEERTSLGLFQDWIDRITYKADIPYLPAPKMPFLGVSHYPALDGFGEAGITRRMFIDGNAFKVDGVFNADSTIGQKLLDAVKTELALVKKGEHPDKPIRISAGWWDIQHYHEDSDFLFTRQALADKCPLCEQSQTSDKVYKAGQLDHFAATRVPMNPRTNLKLEEKSVGKSDADDGGELHPAMVTRATKIGSFIKSKREALDMTKEALADQTSVTASTIGAIEAGEHLAPEKLLRQVGKAIDVPLKDLMAMLPAGTEKSDTDEDEAETIKAGHMKPGEFLKNIRRKKKKAHGDVEKRAGFKRGRLKRIEDDEDEIDFETMAGIAEALDMDDEEMEDMGQRFGKRRKAEHEDDDEDDEAEAPPKGSKKEQLLARFGNKRRKTPPIHKGATNLEDSEIPAAKIPETFSATAYDNFLAENGIKMDYDGHGQVEIGMSIPLLGGATSLKEADAYIQAQEKMDKMYSYWDMLQIAFHNIKRDEEIPDKLKAVSNLFREMAGKIDTLKAGLSDAFLIQESAAAYDDYEDAEDDIEYLEKNDEVETMNENEIIHPADQLKAAYDVALKNESLSGADRETAVQAAFNAFAEAAQNQLQAADPASQADQIAGAIKGALVDVLGPLTEQMGLLTAKMGSVETPQPQGVTQLHEVYVPQQKSMMAPPVTPQPVQPTPGLRISPITGKPSRLRDMVEKSVGMVT
jgi:transcriptional regulator with XRE-family HTH domain/cation transport regulator ChaB